MSLDVPTPASFSPPNNIGANSAETRPLALSSDSPAPVPPGFFDGGIARDSARNSNLVVGVGVAEDSSLALSTKNLPSVSVAVDIDLGTARPESPALSDNDRLISALRACFSDLLEKQDELQKAVEALRLPVPVTDKKNTFWTSYMKLADEHDKEFKEKYGTDLDTSLIFSGLFSAVSSAFIIQIQPDLAKPASIAVIVVQSLLYISLFTTLLAALLAVLGKQWIMYYQAAGSRGTIEERGLERQRKLDGLQKWKFDTVLQMFPLLLQLALLLFWTGLSIYLWTIDQSIAIIVLILTSLGFCAYIFLLGSAVLSPDSPFQTPLAQFLPQLMLIILPLLLPAHRLWRNSKALKYRLLAHFHEFHINLLSCFSTQSTAQVTNNTPPWGNNPFALLKSPKPSAVATAVLWVLETSTDPTMINAAAEIAVDFQWPVDIDLTLSMTRMEEALYSCFYQRSNDHWGRHIRAGMLCRATTYAMVYCSLRHVSRAAGCRDHTPRFKLYETIIPEGCPSDLRMAIGMFNEWPNSIFCSEPSHITKWALSVIPSIRFKTKFGRPLRETIEHFLNQFSPDNLPKLDEEEACNYLCCLNSFFGPVDPRIMQERDKRQFNVVLMTELFKNLRSTTLDTTLVARIIKNTSSLLKNGTGGTTPPWLGQVRTLMTEISECCSALPKIDGWLNLAMCAAMLARVYHGPVQPFYHRDQYPAEIKTQDSRWISMVLEHVGNLQTENTHQVMEWDVTTDSAVEGLLALLVWNKAFVHAGKPSKMVLSMIMQALGAGSNASFWAFLVLAEAHSLFLHKPIMQQSSVLTHLGSIVSRYHDLHEIKESYIELAHDIACIPEWKPVLQNELSTWISVLNSVEFWNETLSRKFNSVIRKIWLPHMIEHHFSGGFEESWALSLAALANKWEHFDFSDSSRLQECVHLARGTVSVALQTYYDIVIDQNFYTTSREFQMRPIPPHLRAIFSPPLGRSLVCAAQNTSKAIHGTGEQDSGSETSHPKHRMDVLSRITGLLEALGIKVDAEHGPRRPGGMVLLEGSMKEYDDWTELQELFNEEIDSIEKLLATGPVR